MNIKFHYSKKLFLSSLIILLFGMQISFANIASDDFYKFGPSQFSTNGEIVAEVWNSDEGIKRLNNSEYKSDFYQLANFFQPQINPLYCGVASSVIILNAIGNKNNNIESQKLLEVLRPSSVGGGFLTFKSYSQATFLNEETDKIKDRKIIELKNIYADKKDIDAGFTIDQLSSILNKVYKLNVTAHHISKFDNKELENFRNLLERVLNDNDNYIVANFDGKLMGLKSGGHISPLVAYDKESDSVLILDVAGHKNPWSWVKVEHLYKAMNSKDGAKYRGYLIISGQN